MAATEAAANQGPDLDKGYEPARVEARWAADWEAWGLFKAEDRSDKPAYSIVLPPPNVTGSLHLGHALTATLQDVLIRWRRMSGDNACWLPGTDHAGIATQMVVEKELQKAEGKSRHDLGREEFVRRVWEWKERYGRRIGDQHRALGASLDWSRERFTMDEGSSRAVREAFVRLHEQGLLYRSERLINWCTRCRTALSDLEVEHEEGHKTELYKFAYPLADGSGEIVVATTRPETMLGDTAIAVHPDDPRYQAMIGKHVRHPIVDRTFPIVADAELVDPKFGTGAVKVTPAHSFEDFEAGKRGKLELINILNLDGTLNERAGRFAGQDRIKVRPALKAALAEAGLERGSEPHTLPLGRCQRCDSVVEPLLSKQWFVRTAPLAQPVIEAVEAGRIKFVPQQWESEFFRWMRNIQDWCVSRQLWWGHQIPAWFCDGGHVTVARAAPAACQECGSKELTQDPDVLDTWFSSGLWPFSTFGWPDKTAALETFYPNAVMETGFDILFFWVARMAMMGLHFMGDVPFRTVFLHAMVRDEKGQKMSKTKGNVIDPLEITAKHGADSLRFTLASMAAQGRDIKLSVDRIAGYRAFANKIWNAARFVLMNAEGYDPNRPAAPHSVYDRWLLSRLSRCAAETNAALDQLRFSDAALGVYKFVWGELCDWGIELSKPALQGDDAAARAGAQATLMRTLEGALRLLHPFMPFVTEEIWQRLPKAKGHPRSIMLAPYPAASAKLEDPAAEAEMALVARAIDGARSVRGEVNLPPNQRIPLILLPQSEATRVLLQKHLKAFSHLANAEPVTLAAPRSARPAQAAVHVEPELEVHLPLAGLIDFAEEERRVDKELAKIDAELLGIDKRLGNEGFVARAPKEVVEKDRARAEELRAKRDKLSRHRARLTNAETGMEENRFGSGTPSQEGAEPQQAGGDQGRAPGQMGTHGGPMGHEPSPHAESAPQAPERSLTAREEAEDARDAEEMAEREAPAAAPPKRPAQRASAGGQKSKARAKGRMAMPAKKAAKAPAKKASAPKRKAAAKPAGKKASRGAAKAGKGAGRSAARGAKKAAGRGKMAKPAKAKARATVRGAAQGRGAQKGARGKSAAKARPAARRKARR